MSRTVVVEVTAEDIAAGKRQDCDACPIARAASRAIGTPCWASMRRIGRLDGSAAVADTPGLAREFMEAFDSGRPVEPFTFTVELS